MAEEDCIKKGDELLKEAEKKKSVRLAFLSSYYFFWGGNFDSAKKALKRAYENRKEGDYLPLDYKEVSSLMGSALRAGIGRSFSAGLADALKGKSRSDVESALRQGGVGDARQAILEYLDFDYVTFLNAHRLYDTLVKGEGF